MQTEELKQKINSEIHKVKLIEVSQMARNVMYPKQKVFRYRDKPNTYLGQVLAEVKEKPSFPDFMLLKDRAGVNTLQCKLKISSEYCADLY